MSEAKQSAELHFKKGQVICRAGEFELCMYNILLGSAKVCFDYGTDEEMQVEELHEGDFINVISFLEARPRKSTVVAQERTVVVKITSENFSEFFTKRPAKIMQLLQGMSARMRYLTADYLKVCEELEEKTAAAEVDSSGETAEPKSILRTIIRKIARDD